MLDLRQTPRHLYTYSVFAILFIYFISLSCYLSQLFLLFLSLPAWVPPLFFVSSSCFFFSPLNFALLAVSSHFLVFPFFSYSRAFPSSLPLTHTSILRIMTTARTPRDQFTCDNQTTSPTNRSIDPTSQALLCVRKPAKHGTVSVGRRLCTKPTSEPLASTCWHWQGIHLPQNGVICGMDAFPSNLLHWAGCLWSVHYVYIFHAQGETPQHRRYTQTTSAQWYTERAPPRAQFVMRVKSSEISSHITRHAFQLQIRCLWLKTYL